MDGDEFVRLIKKAGRRHGVAVHFDPRRGKGSHGRLYYGQRFTTVKRSEVSPGLFAKMLKDLGLSRTDL